MISRNEARNLAKSGVILAALVFAIGMLAVYFPGPHPPPAVLLLAYVLGSFVFTTARDLVTGESWRERTWVERAIARRRSRC